MFLKHLAQHVAHSECLSRVAIIIIIHIHIIIMIMCLSTLESTLVLRVLSRNGGVTKAQGSPVPRPSWGPRHLCVLSLPPSVMVPSLAASELLRSHRSWALFPKSCKA